MIVDESTIIVRVVIFTKWGGFFENVYVMDKDNPSQLLDVQHNPLIEMIVALPSKGVYGNDWIVTPQNTDMVRPAPLAAKLSLLLCFNIVLTWN